MKCGWLVWLLWAPMALAAQNAVPAGTVLPLRLDTGLNAKKLKPDQLIHARLMQNVPGTKLHRGAQVLGRVISVAPNHIELRFDMVQSHGARIRVTTNLRALASMLEVEEAAIPEGGADRSLPPDQRNSTQIGGDEVYRGGGPVTEGMDVVGRPTAYGVLARVEPKGPCRDGVDDNQAPQALWLFSADACGIYGYENLRIVHAGRTKPVGTIELAANGTLNIRSGSGLLLRVESDSGQ